MDHIEVRNLDDVLDLISLNMTNKVPADILRQDLRLGNPILHVILSKIKAPSFVRLHDRDGRLGLGNCDEGHVLLELVVGQHPADLGCDQGQELGDSPVLAFILTTFPVLMHLFTILLVVLFQRIINILINNLLRDLLLLEGLAVVLHFLLRVIGLLLLLCFWLYYCWGLLLLFLVHFKMF